MDVRADREDVAIELLLAEPEIVAWLELDEREDEADETPRAALHTTARL
jgi:hypothetical protein